MRLAAWAPVLFLTRSGHGNIRIYHTSIARPVEFETLSFNLHAFTCKKVQKLCLVQHKNLILMRLLARALVLLLTLEVLDVRRLGL